MSDNSEREVQIKDEESDKNLNINVQINNLEDYNIIDDSNKFEQKNINNDFQNLISNQKSINFIENAPKFEQEMNSNSLNTNNNLEEEEENNNIINNNIEDECYNENDDMNFEQESINKINNENNSNNEDEELPLITLNFISVCQCCKNSFDNNIYKPYLLKCGHFFCIKCIKDYFTDQNGIKCPSDGLIAKSLDELTFLNNLIPKEKTKKDKNKKNFPKIDNKINISQDKNNIKDNNSHDFENSSINNNYNENNYCSIHKGQKLSHIICDSNEIICVYCAFESFKKNPKREIKEISSQITEFINNINEIISSNQNEVLNLHNALKKIKNNKETEEKSISSFFESLIDYIKEKQNELIEKVNEIFNNNTKKLGDKLEEVTENIEKSEIIKNLIETFCEKEKKNENNIKENYNEILSKYLIFQQKINKNNQNLILDEYKFEHLDEEQINHNFQNLGQIIFLNKKRINSNINDKILFKENFNKELNKQSIKNFIFGENDENLNKSKEKISISNIRSDKSVDNIKNNRAKKNRYEMKKKLNYIILDDYSLNRNNNSFLNSNKNTTNYDMNNEDENNNNYSKDNKTINGERIKKDKFINRFDLNTKRKNTLTINRNKNRNLLTTNGKSQYNYIDFPNYNSNLTNYYMMSKIGKRDKEKNNITVNNYEVHQTLKNSFNNNINYGHNYNNSNYLNKIIEFNNLVLNGYNTSTNKTKTNRNKFSMFNNNKYNLMFNFK